MELTSDLINVIAQGGISVIIFVIWYLTFKTTNKQYVDIVERLFKQIEQDVKYKELLVGILTRLESKLDANKWKENR
jgi:hypothetical protein